MKKVFKWIGLILGALLVIVLTSVFILIGKANKIMTQKFDISPTYFTIHSDSAAIARGEKFSNLCRECHGKKLEGFAFFNVKSLGMLYAPNLTKGEGSAIDNYSDVDWIRSIRHGVRPNGEGLKVMPSKDYYNMSKNDISDLIAYLKTIPPVDNVRPGENHLTIMGKILLATGAFGESYSANEIDHNKPVGTAPPVGATVAYGDYMVKVSGCRTCHGKELNGGKDPNPEAPPVPNITPGGNLGKWNLEGFLTTMRTGKTPEGKQLDRKFMPYPAFVKIGDDELSAVFMYLQSLTPKPTAK